MFRHLLVPLDGTPMAEAVLPVAASLARQTGSRITLLHVIEKKVPTQVHGKPHLTSASEAEEYLNRIAADGFPPGTPVTVHVHTREVPDVAHSVVDHADELSPDLVVMCSHGGHGLREWFSGNIAQQVVRQGITPVLFVRSDPDGRARYPFQQILVPLDGEASHEAGIPAAQMIAITCGASVELVQVIPTRTTLSGPQGLTRAHMPRVTEAILNVAEEEAPKYLAAQIARFQASGVNCHARVMRGDPAEEIIKTAQDTRTDLIVLGTHGHIGTDAFWSGSVTPKLLDRIPLSFLLVPVGES
jgi:nucleotide-binding universal stress UspA family protein